MNIGSKIKSKRKELGLTVEEVAEKLGKNRATVYRYESSEIENLPITILEPLAVILNTTPAELMGWDELEDNKNSVKKFTEQWNLKSNEKKLVENYRKLNEIGRNRLIEYSEDLTMNNKYTFTVPITMAAHDDNIDEETKINNFEKIDKIYKDMHKK